MKIQLLKDHGNSIAGHVLKVTVEEALELISDGIAIALKQEKVVVKTKELKTRRKTKTKTVIKSVNVPEDLDDEKSAE